MIGTRITRATIPNIPRLNRSTHPVMNPQSSQLNLTPPLMSYTDTPDPRHGATSPSPRRQPDAKAGQKQNRGFSLSGFRAAQNATHVSRATARGSWPIAGLRVWAGCGWSRAGCQGGGGADASVNSRLKCYKQRHNKGQRGRGLAPWGRGITSAFNTPQDDVRM